MFLSYAVIGSIIVPQNSLVNVKLEASPELSVNFDIPGLICHIWVVSLLWHHKISQSVSFLPCQAALYAALLELPQHLVGKRRVLSRLHDTEGEILAYRKDFHANVPETLWCLVQTAFIIAFLSLSLTTCTAG